MRLIKLKNDHYIIVADSEIKEDDWYYWEITKTIQIAKLDSLNRLPKNSDGSKKITHSTQPLEDVGLGKYDLRFNKIFALDLDEIKELTGEVDVEKKMISPYSVNTQNNVDWCNGYQRGYTQALEDNKEKKYTEEDVIAIVEKSRATGLTAEYIIQSLQPKTEWEVEIVDGKLKLK